MADTLIAWLEAATEKDQREGLLAAANHARLRGWINDAEQARMFAFIEVGAFLDAALILVPGGYDVWLIGVSRQISNGVFTHDYKPYAEVMNAQEQVFGEEAATPALALCIAALKAWEQSHG